MAATLFTAALTTIGFIIGQVSEGINEILNFPAKNTHFTRFFATNFLRSIQMG